MKQRQRGIALPVMLIMLTVMLLSSLYLLRSSTSGTLMATNLAYDSALVKAADLGLLRGFQWLKDTAAGNKVLLEQDSAGNGYLATFNTALTPASSAFWNGSQSFTDADTGNRIEYVIHRMCAFTGPYDRTAAPANSCMQTAPNTNTLNNAVALGDSLSVDAINLAGMPQVHYIVTARIFGARGGNVVNQSIVLIGA